MIPIFFIYSSLFPGAVLVFGFFVAEGLFEVDIQHITEAEQNDENIGSFFVGLSATGVIGELDTDVFARGTSKFAALLKKQHEALGYGLFVEATLLEHGFYVSLQIMQGWVRL